MHFSRNPPGPNTSCIEGFADSLDGLSAAPSAALPPAVGSSSRRTYSPRTVFAARLTFDSGGSPAALDARFARNPPLFSPYETERPATITHPFPWPPSPACSQATRPCISLVSRHLRVEHASCFCGVILLSPALQSAVGTVSVFLSGRANADQSIVGCHMNRSKALSIFPALLLAALSLASCSGPQNIF